MIKLVIADMDGTLLDSNHEINPEFWEVYAKLRKKGILFSPASGRQYWNLLKNFEEIKEDLVFVSENGTFVVQNGEEIFSDILDFDMAMEFIKVSRNIENIGLVLCGKNSAYIEDTREEFIAEVEKYYEKYQIVKSFDEVKDEIIKVAIYDFICSEENTYPHYKDYADSYKVVISGKHWLDIMNITANKGHAVESLQKKLGITPEETMVFGDYLNDYEMMSTAKYSFAMDNAHPKLKEVANYIADGHDENGVVRAIKKYIDLD